MRPSRCTRAPHGGFRYLGSRRLTGPGGAHTQVLAEPATHALELEFLGMVGPVPCGLLDLAGADLELAQAAQALEQTRRAGYGRPYFSQERRRYAVQSGQPTLRSVSYPVTVTVEQQDELFVAHSDQPELSSQGSSAPEALANYAEALAWHLEEPKPAPPVVA